MNDFSLYLKFYAPITDNLQQIESCGQNEITLECSQLRRRPRSRVTSKGQGRYNVKRQIKINHVNGKTNNWSPWTRNASTKVRCQPNEVRHPRKYLMLTYIHRALHLTCARIHFRFTKA
jgi:hypothetical protein